MKVTFFFPLLSFHLYAYSITVQQGLLQRPTVIKTSDASFLANHCHLIKQVLKFWESGKVVLLKQCKLFKLTTRGFNEKSCPVFLCVKKKYHSKRWLTPSKLCHVCGLLALETKHVCLCVHVVCSRWGLVLTEPNSGPHKGTTYTVETLMVKEHFQDRQSKENAKLLTDWWVNQ